MNEVIDHMDELEQDRFEARYFNRMSAEEARAFDVELESDPELTKKYRAFQLAIKGILSTREQLGSSSAPSDLRQRLREIDRELDGSGRKLGWYGLAAAAAVLLAIGVWWLQRPPEHQRLAQEFAIHEPGLPVLMNSNQGTLDPVMNDLKLGHFENAYAALEDLLEQRPANDTLHYFAGVAAGELQEFDMAIGHLQNVPENSIFKRKALYHTALFHLHQHRQDSASIILEELAGTANDQLSERARELLDRL